VFHPLTLTLLFGVCGRMVFNLGGGRHNMTNENGCCHKESCKFEDKSF